MPVAGWMNVRSLPSTKDKSVKEVTNIFFEKYDLCPKCKGRCFLVNDSQIDILPDTTTVKFQDYEALVKMRGKGHLTCDVLKKIVETIVYGREQCKHCFGFGFIKK